MAGFQVITYGRFWGFTEVGGSDEVVGEDLAQVAVELGADAG